MWSVVEAAEAVRSGRLKATEVLDECLARIESSNPELNAFVHLDPEGARRAAEAVDAAVASGRDPGPLAGVPFGVKDLEDCAGMPTSHGSLLYKGRGPVAADSVHVARLRAAGAVPVGKTAAPEFGAVAFTSTPAWGTTRNPWDTAVTPGGSSGGSAAAVSSGMVPFCTASDGGGSTRIPAAFTGLVGFKAGFGRIPHPGFGGMSETTVLGALTTTVADAARHLDVAAGPHDADRASLPASGFGYEAAIAALDVSGLRAVWSPDLGFALVDPEVGAICEEAAAALVSAAGLRPVERRIDLTDPVRVWLSSGAADVWVSLEPGMWPERADEFDRPVRRTLEQTEAYPVSRFARAHRRRTRLDAEWAEVFADVDVVITPTTAVPAFDAAGRMPRSIGGVDVDPVMAVPFTMVANLCWNPAVSLPAGLTSGGLPVGLQVIARRHHDHVALRLARIFEEARPWPRLAPGW
ncbi:MAG TPA: amidase family protein [Acidimicrobiales bacterium]|nr:amidase family protein [Acidimicrobiales bacterium]